MTEGEGHKRVDKLEGSFEKIMEEAAAVEEKERSS